MKARNFVRIPMMLRIFAILLLLAIGIFPSGGQLPEHILRAQEDRYDAGLIFGLMGLREENGALFLEKDFDYLLGRSAAASGRLGIAASSYHSVIDRNSALEPYALKHLSQIARSTGNLVLERLYLTELELEFPSSLPTKGAAIRRARNRIESGDPVEAIRLLERVSVFPYRRNEKGDTREIRALLGMAYVYAGQAPKAREIFLALMNEKPDRPDDHSLTAARGLDLIEEDGAAPLSVEEHFRRANIYSSNREFAEAEKHLQAIVDKTPTGDMASDAIFQIGRGHAQRGDHAGALKWFERVLEREPHSPAAKEALLNAASAYSRVGKPREAISRYQSFISKYPADAKLDRAYLNIVDVLRDQGSDSEALKWCGTVREIFGNTLPSNIALFTEARIYIAREEWNNALRILEQLKTQSDLGGTSVPGGTSGAEVSFLTAFVLEQLKRYPEAIDGYLSIPDGRAEYYGWRATVRISSLAADEAASSFIDQKIGTLFSSMRSGNAEARDRDAKAVLRLANSPDLRQKALEILRSSMVNTIAPLEKKNESRVEPASPMAARLRQLGIYDEAAEEYEFSAGISDGSFIADLYNKGDRPARALDIAERRWKKVPADTPLEALPRGELQLLYPTPYADRLIEFGGPRNIDPRFILALMRQESRFDPDARSGASARGLMQFVSATSTRIAGQLGRTAFVHEDLYHPSTAILFGSQYLSELFARFPQQPEAVAASYNGGDDSMARWLNRARSGAPDRYVPEIVYSQTKDYVTKVMANYRVYQFLYDESLKPRTE